MLLSILLLSATDPMRTTDIDIQSSQSLVDLQSCSMRILAAHGRVTPIPVENGVSIDFQMPGLGLTGPGEAKLAFVVTDVQGARHITATYRHPLSAKTATGMLRDTAKRCFKDEYNAASVEARGGGKPID